MFFNKNKKLLEEVRNENAILSEQIQELQVKYAPLIEFDKEIELRKAELRSIRESFEQFETKRNSLAQTLSELSRQKEASEADVVALGNEVGALIERKAEESREVLQIEIRSNELQGSFALLERTLAEVKQQFALTLENDSDLRAQAEHLHLEIDDLREQFAQLDEKYQQAFKIYGELERRVELYRDTLDISEYGLYDAKFSFDLSEQYKLELESNYQKQKSAVTSGVAVQCNTEWSVGGSAVEGRRMTKQYTKLMLYAFNGECDALVAKVKWNNITKAELRILQTFNNVNKLGSTHNIFITQEYLKLKLEELSLAYEYEQKKQEEKEEQRRIREQMREEERAQREFEKAQREAEDEERKCQKALDKAKQEIALSNPSQIEALNEKIKLLEQSLYDAQERKLRAISLAQMTKVGHIYVISNVGSFGENVYKIGMTRRLDPLDRVRELGDASVPFHFDIHAIIFSENAPQLEYELHQKFKDRRINRMNNRKEFFRVSLDEIEALVRTHTNAEIEFTKAAEAREYRETLTLLERLNLGAEHTLEIDNFPRSLI